MTTDQIKSIQQRIGTTPDGFWGPKSIVACQRHLRDFMPQRPWPDPDQHSLTDFYGLPGDESQLVNLPVDGLGVCYEGQPVKTIRCHAKVVASLLRVIKAIHSGPNAHVLAKYAGCYDNRPMRNGSLPSLHARGAAIDLWPEANDNHQSWPVSASMPLGVMEEFAKEGWIAAGSFWGRDAMHFQATR